MNVINYKNGTRNDYLDICKAIAIILVVLGHCVQYGQGSEFLNQAIFFNNPLFIFIYSFHMPFFMLISGYLFSFSIKKKDWKTIIKNKCFQLIIPLFFWGCVSTFIRILVNIIKGNQITIIWVIKTVISNFINGPWFLWAIWWCSFVVLIVYTFFNNSKMIYLLVLIITFVIPDAFGLDTYKFMYPFFVLSFFFGYLNIYQRKKKMISKYFTKIFFFILFLVLLYFYNYDSYIYTTGYTVLGGDILYQIYNDIFRFTIGLIGSVAIFYIVDHINKIMRLKIRRVLTYIGMNSMGIYLISGYIFKYLFPKITDFFIGINYLVAILETVFVLLVSLAINLVIKKAIILNVILLGNRR